MLKLRSKRKRAARLREFRNRRPENLETIAEKLVTTKNPSKFSEWSN